MTFTEFIQKWEGKGIDFDGAFGNQCVDLYRAYVRDVLGFPQSPAVKGAAWIRYNYDPSKYDWIANTPLAIPQFGDILIWDTRAGGGFGHVAIFISGNLFSFTSFDINWPSQGYYDRYGNFIGTGVAHKQGHNYFGGLVGWLRPKTSVVAPPVDFKERVRQIVNGAGSGDEKIDRIRAIL